MGFFDHFRKKKEAEQEAEKSAKTAQDVKETAAEEKKGTSASMPKADSFEEQDVPQVESAESANGPETEKGSGVSYNEKPEMNKAEGPDSSKDQDGGEQTKQIDAKAPEQSEEKSKNQSEEKKTDGKEKQMLGVKAVFRVDAAFSIDHDGTPAVLVSGFLEQGTIKLGDSLVLVDTNNRVRATFPVSGLERLGRSQLPQITYEKSDDENQNAYAIYVNQSDPKIFEQGFKCYRIEQNRGQNNPDRVSKERSVQLAGMLKAGILKDEDLNKLSIQEVCFLIRMIRLMHEQNEVSDFENKEEQLENCLCAKIEAADELFITMDRTTNMPFLDQGAVDIYSKESFARDAVDFYRRQFRQLVILRYRKEASPFPNKMSLCRYLYYTGVSLVTVDNGQFKVTVDRTQIEKDPGLNELNRLPLQGVTNADLRFALNSLLSEARWPVKYPQHAQNIKLREVRMLNQLEHAILLLPVRIEGHKTTGIVNFSALPKNARIQIPHITDKKGNHYLPFFTDPFEFERLYSTKEWAAATCDIRRALLMDRKIGIVINPMAENFVLTLDGKKAIVQAYIARDKAIKEAQEKRKQEEQNGGPESPKTTD